MTTSQARGAVVAGVDATSGAGPVLAWAADEAALRGLPLHVVLAVDASAPESGRAAPGPVPAPGGPAAPAAVAALLEEAREAAVARHPGLTVVCEPADGSAVDALRALAPGSVMVVIGSRHRGIVRDLVSRDSLGPSLVAQAACPVVVVGGPESVPQAPPRMVVGVDGSGVSREAVRFAFEEAAFRGARLIAVAAWEPQYLRDLALEDAEDEVRRVLAESTAGWREKYPDVELRHEVVRGHPAGVLGDAAQGAVQLVVGSRGLGGFSGLLLGSVSRSLMRRATCPVVVVPHRAGEGVV
ncbi:universal stress protein [Streptomyces sp. NPDC020490]|uniref:universal stress protein n=1 Tax=Streptomyces sp. NPDC020490 TaxID=3365078 RepID=UPI0037A4A870